MTIGGTCDGLADPFVSKLYVEADPNCVREDPGLESTAPGVAEAIQRVRDRREKLAVSIKVRPAPVLAQRRCCRVRSRTRTGL